jgi:hypothetical protein
LRPLRPLRLDPPLVIFEVDVQGSSARFTPEVHSRGSSPGFSSWHHLRPSPPSVSVKGHLRRYRIWSGNGPGTDLSARGASP